MRGEIERNGNFDFDAAIGEARRAIDLAPNFAEGHAALALNLAFAGEPDAAIAAAQAAIRLDPLFPVMSYVAIGLAHLTAGDNEAAISPLETALRHSPNTLAGLFLIAAYGHPAKSDKAAEAIADFNSQLAPVGEGPITGNYAYLLPFREPSLRNQLYEGLRKAGLRSIDREAFSAELDRRLESAEIRALLIPSRSRRVKFEAASSQLCHRWSCGSYHELTPDAAATWQASHVDIEENGHRLYFTHIKRLQATDD